MATVWSSRSPGTPCPGHGTEVKALLIPVDGPAMAADLPGGGGTRFMNSIRALIGTGCAERIRVTTRWEAWLDENGTSAGRQVNQAATRLAQSFGWQLSLAGPVVIVGLDQDTNQAALSPDQIDAILNKIKPPAALHPPCRSGSATPGRRSPVHVPDNSSANRTRTPEARFSGAFAPAVGSAAQPSASRRDRWPD